LEKKIMETSEALPPAEPTERFARKLFSELHQGIIRNESHAVVGEVEAIHDMRVGVRRLRVAISNFTVCLDKDDRQRVINELKNLADALGVVRDLDVTIESLKSSLRASASSDQPVIGEFIGRLRARRRRRLRKLSAYLHSEEYLAFKNEFSGVEGNNVECGEEAQDEQAA